MANGKEVAIQEESVEDRLKSLLGALEAKAPAETKALGELVRAIQDKNIAVLGTDDVFKLTDQGGEIRAFRSVVRLSSSAGTLVQPVYNGPYVISAQGYEQLEEAAGVVKMKPQQVLVDGEYQSNPYTKYDPKNGRPLQVFCRTISFRFTSKGIPQVSDWTTIFDVKAYRLIDLLAKAKEFPQAFRLLPIDAKPEDAGTWAKYDFDDATCLWVNTSHPQALDFFKQIINREKKILDFAQTFSARNSVKHLLGLQRVPGQEVIDQNGKKSTRPINTWAVPVICWRPINGSLVKWDLTRYKEVQQAITRAASGDNEAIMIDGATKGLPGRLQIQEGREEVGLDDPHNVAGIEAEDGEAEVEGPGSGNGEPNPPPGLGEEPPPPEPPSTPKTKAPEGSGPLFEQPNGKPRVSALKQLEVMQKASPEVVRAAAKELQMGWPITEDGAQRLLNRANEIAQRPVQRKK